MKKNPIMSKLFKCPFGKNRYQTFSYLQFFTDEFGDNLLFTIKTYN